VVVDDALIPAADVGPDASPSLQVVDLAFAYPDGHRALDGVDLVIGRGERVALLGPNGAGKTTLVLHLNGVLQPERGTVTVAGLAVDKPSLREIRRRVGIVFQDPDDQLFMPTVRDDVAFGPANLGLRGAELDARVDHALALVGMQAYVDRPPNHLSYGQRRRVAVATVLAMEPEVLVLDEPSSNLDPAGIRDMRALVKRLAADGLTVLLSSHDMSEVEEICDNVTIRRTGSVV
jgi:cobalt/nickel transport system ATP-binding protein